MSYMVFRSGKPPLDYDKITIGGQQATKMSREAVFDAMEKLGVPGIESTMGLQTLLTIFVDSGWFERESWAITKILDRGAA